MLETKYRIIENGLVEFLIQEKGFNTLWLYWKTWKDAYYDQEYTYRSFNDAHAALESYRLCREHATNTIEKRKSKKVVYHS